MEIIKSKTLKELGIAAAKLDALSLTNHLQICFIYGKI